jgi:hypothetical protein
MPMCEDAPCCGCCGPEPFDNEPPCDADDINRERFNRSFLENDEDETHHERESNPNEDKYLDSSFEDRFENWNGDSDGSVGLD